MKIKKINNRVIEVKERKGVSLTILVITVIVLVILAATTISILYDEDIIEESQQVVTDLEVQQIITAIKLEIKKYRLDKELQDIYEISTEEIKDIIKQYGVIQDIEGEPTLVNTEKGYKIKLSDIDPIFVNN